MLNNIDRKTNADRILYEYGLIKRLEEIGKPHIIGSYRMDMMAWNDLDIDIENDTMSLDKMYELSAFIINTFHPVWYEAKEKPILREIDFVAHYTSQRSALNMLENISNNDYVDIDVFECNSFWAGKEVSGVVLF